MHSRLHFRRIVAALSILLVIVVELSFTHAPTSAQSPQSDSAVMPSTRFGAVESYYRPQDAVEAGLSWQRIIFEWRYLEPNGPDDWDTSKVPDEWLANAQRDGQMVIGLLKNAPHWATGSNLLGAVPKGLELSIDDPGNVWAAFVKKTVKYYGDKWNIHHWIIYNEPDIRPEDTQMFEFAGTLKDYYQMVKVAYKAAKATDPKVVIHLAGLTIWQDIVHQREQYLTRFLRLAVSDPEARANNLFFDVLTVHIFAGTESVWRMTQFFKALPEAFGYPKPVWINEFNILPTVDGDWPIKRIKPDVSLDEQASFIIQGIALALAAGAERIEIYRLFDDNAANDYEAWGLVRADGTRRPAYYAVQTASKYFNDTVTAQRYSTLDATLVTLVQPDKTVYVVWNETKGPFWARIQKTGSGVTLLTPTGKTVTPDTTEQGNYEFALPPCVSLCYVNGEPRIFIQAGAPQPVWLVNKQGIMKLN